MGNTPDKTADKGFMEQTENMMKNFNKDEPLFHVEDIEFPLSTDEMKIVDQKKRRVKLAGASWSGAHMCRHCIDGLQCRPLKQMAMEIRFKFKMNVVRLTYSIQLILDNDIVPEKYLTANPELIGKTSMQIFDFTIQTLTSVGLMVILNNHTSTSQWCCSNDDGDGLWWSRKYPQYQYFKHVQQFAKRYGTNERVIGIDLRNQIRKANGIQPTWGTGNARSDWRRAATRSGNIALKHAPHWLIFVGGINYQLDLSGVKENPIELDLPNKLVYTGHFYGFSWPIPSWNVYTYQSFKKRLFNTQTYVRSLGVPYLLGQFGSNIQDIPWKYLIQYLKQTNIDWIYWALDGFKCEKEKDETFGIFTNDFTRVRHPEMLEDLINVGPPPTSLKNYWQYLPGKDFSEVLEERNQFYLQRALEKKQRDANKPELEADGKKQDLENQVQGPPLPLPNGETEKQVQNEVNAQENQITEAQKTSKKQEEDEEIEGSINEDEKESEQEKLKNI